jgi:hypothetical protein
VVAPDAQVHVDPQLEVAEPALLEPRLLDAQLRADLHVGQGGATPQLQRGGQLLGREHVITVCRGAAARVGQLVVPSRVDLVRLDVQAVAAVLGDEDVLRRRRPGRHVVADHRVQLLPQVPDVGV